MFSILKVLNILILVFLFISIIIEKILCKSNQLQIFFYEYNFQWIEGLVLTFLSNNFLLKRKKCQRSFFFTLL